MTPTVMVVITRKNNTLISRRVHMREFLTILLLSVFAFSAEIKIDVSNCKMFFNHDGISKEYTVATPKVGVPIPKGVGYITAVDLEPTWYPTQRTKDYFKDHKGIILPSAVEYGNKNNYMGAFKITMTNKTERGAIYRIHGNVDDSTIGKRSSGGCVRMYNIEGKEFAKIIKQLVGKERITIEYI